MLCWCWLETVEDHWVRLGRPLLPQCATRRDLVLYLENLVTTKDKYRQDNEIGNTITQACPSETKKKPLHYPKCATRKDLVLYVERFANTMTNTKTRSNKRQRDWERQYTGPSFRKSPTLILPPGRTLQVEKIAKTRTKTNMTPEFSLQQMPR